MLQQSIPRSRGQRDVDSTSGKNLERVGLTWPDEKTEAVLITTRKKENTIKVEIDRYVSTVAGNDD